MASLVSGAEGGNPKGMLSPHPPLPPAPSPGDDKGALPPPSFPPIPEDGSIPEHVDIFQLKATTALKMLVRNVDALVGLTGDVPPTPPISSRNTPATSPYAPSRVAWQSDKIQRMSAMSPPLGPYAKDHIDGVPLVNPAIGSPEAPHSETLNIIGGDSEPLQLQHGAIARKFYSKRPPPISTEEYVLRLHRYCPMSTAVYLASSLYINRLAVVDRLLPVTPRNVHRLLLAALRVAMKALEDMRYAHSRFAKVGGVSELELGRLEISFCYLTSFELKVDVETLQKEADESKEGRYGSGLSASFQPKLPIRHRKKLSEGVVTRTIDETVPTG